MLFFPTACFYEEFNIYLAQCCACSGSTSILSQGFLASRRLWFFWGENTIFIGMNGLGTHIIWTHQHVVGQNYTTMLRMWDHCTMLQARNAHEKRPYIYLSLEKRNKLNTMWRRKGRSHSENCIVGKAHRYLGLCVPCGWSLFIFLLWNRWVKG